MGSGVVEGSLVPEIRVAAPGNILVIHPAQNSEYTVSRQAPAWQHFSHPLVKRPPGNILVSTRQAPAWLARLADGAAWLALCQPGGGHVGLFKLVCRHGFRWGPL